MSRAQACGEVQLRLHCRCPKAGEIWSCGKRSQKRKPPATGLGMITASGDKWSIATLNIQLPARTGLLSRILPVQRCFHRLLVSTHDHITFFQADTGSRVRFPLFTTTPLSALCCSSQQPSIPLKMVLESPDSDCSVAVLGFHCLTGLPSRSRPGHFTADWHRTHFRAQGDKAL